MIAPMFRPTFLYIGLRYTRAKRRGHFISFISLASMIGIALGVAVLITVLSVMNGFDYEIHHRIFELADQVSVSGFTDPLSNWQALATKIETYPKVIAAAPVTNGQGMLVNNGQSMPVIVRGVSPAEENKVSSIGAKMVQGNLTDLQPNTLGMVMGKKLADSLGLKVGDPVVLFIPQMTGSDFGIKPQFKRFTLVGLFDLGGGSLGIDTGVVYINLQDAQTVYNLGNTVSALHLKISDLYAAPTVTTELQNGFNQQYLVTSWIDQYGDYFRTIEMQKTMMFFILVLIIAVAAFNLVASLVMIVNDKRAEIAILRTLGASPLSIMATFMVQGCLVGLIGTFLGLIGGVILALSAPSIVNGIQHLFHVQLVSASVYLVNYLPSKLEWVYVWEVCLIALGLCLLATLYPAWQAARTQPAESLRYE